MTMDATGHHAFISYAGVDDEPFDAPAASDSGHIGWVSTFVDRLRRAPVS